MKNREFAKKRLMFIQKEDYNYLCYNFLLLLDFYNCYDAKSAFKDFRKIAYLIDLISSSKNLGDYQQEELRNIYSKSHLKKKLLSHLLIILKNRNFIGIEINEPNISFNVWLRKENIPSGFFNCNFFEKEFENLKQINKSVNRLRTAKVKTMVNTIFTSRNILTWEI